MAEEATAAMATLEVAPDHKLPPARVRALWKKLDPDGAGGVTLEALEASVRLGRRDASMRLGRHA